MRYHTLEHRFVRNAPRELAPGVLYISMDYATAVHSCCCGCGDRVVTPFTPTDWRMTFDGESVSLHPSVGNWNQNCRSHYVIQHNRVLEAGSWTSTQVEAERRRDKNAKAAYYGGGKNMESGTHTSPPVTPFTTAVREEYQLSRSIWARFKSWLSS